MDQVSIRANVDLMILDYLLGLTISRILAVINKESTHEDVDWFVESVKSESNRDPLPENHTNWAQTSAD
jgi:hypothetical protein